jgi:AcrR family transcriptional regulator
MTEAEPVPGLRERKRSSAIARIQAAALDLFDERGYAAVTVEQIAEASEVSPSSVYRYFGSKEQIVLWSDFDVDLAAALRGDPVDESPLDVTRSVLRSVMDDLVGEDELRIQRRMRHVMSDATLEAALARQVYAASEALGEILAARHGRPSDDLDVQVPAHAIVGALLGGLHHWHGIDCREPLRDVLERCIDILEAGLQVGSPPQVR